MRRIQVVSAVKGVIWFEKERRTIVHQATRMQMIHGQGELLAPFPRRLHGEYLIIHLLLQPLDIRPYYVRHQNTDVCHSAPPQRRRRARRAYIGDLDSY